MNLSLVLQLLSTAIMIIGVVFGIQNIRQYQAGRRRESAITMLNSFQTPDFVQGLLDIFGLPDGIRKVEVDNLPSERQLPMFMVLGTWERLGVLVFRREIDLDLVDDAYSGPIVQSWQRLQQYILDFRALIGRETAMEWFQWLAERMLEREAGQEPVPAYRAHREWRPRG